MAKNAGHHPLSGRGALALLRFPEGRKMRGERGPHISVDVLVQRLGDLISYIQPPSLFVAHQRTTTRSAELRRLRSSVGDEEQASDAGSPAVSEVVQSRCLLAGLATPAFSSRGRLELTVTAHHAGSDQLGVSWSRTARRPSATVTPGSFESKVEHPNRPNVRSTAHVPSAAKRHSRPLSARGSP